jgi:hypothetical protein
MNSRPPIRQCAVLAITVLELIAGAGQAVRAQAFQPTMLRSAAIGFALQDGGSGAYRSTAGITGQVGFGYKLFRRLAAQAELSGAAFDAPERLTNVCARGGGCTEITAGDVTEVSFAGNAIILPGSQPGGHLTLGAGVRRLIHDPERRGSVDPFVQAGIGGTVPVGMSDAWFVELRYQYILSGGGTPTYLIPFTMGVRF